jgi:hypothetical protein
MKEYKKVSLLQGAKSKIQEARFLEALLNTVFYVFLLTFKVYPKISLLEGDVGNADRGRKIRLRVCGGRGRNGR